jgi:hypothetical protein
MFYMPYLNAQNQSRIAQCIFGDKCYTLDFASRYADSVGTTPVAWSALPSARSSPTITVGNATFVVAGYASGLVKETFRSGSGTNATSFTFISNFVPRDEFCLVSLNQSIILAMGGTAGGASNLLNEVWASSKSLLLLFSFSFF